MRFFLLFSLFLFFLNCSTSYKNYFENIPEHEDINASVYNYELILQRLTENLNKTNERDFVSNLNFYFYTFEEFDEEDEQGNILYKFHQGIALFSNKTSFLKSLQKLNKSIQKELFIGFDSKNRLIYSNGILDYLMKSRCNYYLELKAAEKYFTFLIQSKQFNFEKFEKIVKYYPNITAAENFISSPEGSALLEKLSQKKKKKYLKYVDIYKNLIWRENNNYINAQLTNKVRITLRNKPNYLRSRLLHVLFGYEYVFVLNETVTNIDMVETNEPFYWSLIELINGDKGYVEKKYIEHINLNKKENKKIAFIRDKLKKKKYIDLFYFNQKLLSDKNEYMRFLAAKMLISSLHDIAIRATSQKNPYWNFVQKYPSFFEVDDNNLELRVHRDYPVYLIEKHLTFFNVAALFWKFR